MTEAILVPEKTERIDLLDRQDIVERLLTVAKTLSDGKKNACYAVDGLWGSGKSFVLDMFEEQAEKMGTEGETLPRYLILRYNCWEYDYYDEPLVAIVASVLDQIDQKVNLLSQEKWAKIKGVLRAVGEGLAKKAVQIIREKTGLDGERFFEIVKNGVDESNEAVKDIQESDSYFDFKKNLKKLQKVIGSLSADQTIIFIVDELDRCLPEYTIKVLERLHHLFDGIPNVQVLISIDMGQLEHVVRQIYGESTDAKKYLKKIVDFKLNLDVGTIRDNFNQKFKSYTRRFDYLSDTTKAIDVEEFKSYIFEGLEMRDRVSVVERCELLHNILIGEELNDTSYLCLEILLVLLKDSGIDVEHANLRFSIDMVFYGERIYGFTSEKEVLAGLKLLSDRFRTFTDPGYGNRLFYRDTMGDETITNNCLLGKILAAYRAVLGFDKDHWKVEHKEQREMCNYGVRFWKLLNTIE